MEPVYAVIAVVVLGTLSFGIGWLRIDRRTFEGPIRQALATRGVDLVAVRVPGLFEATSQRQPRSGKWRLADGTLVRGPAVVEVSGVHVGDNHHHDNAPDYQLRDVTVRDAAGATHQVWAAVRVDRGAPDIVLFDWPLDRLDG